MEKLSILVVEDDPLARKVMAVQLKDHAVDFAENAAAGRKLLEKGGHALCFLDLQLGDGEETLRSLAIRGLAEWLLGNLDDLGTRSLNGIDQGGFVRAQIERRAHVEALDVYRSLNGPGEFAIPLDRKAP